MGSQVIAEASCGPDPAVMLVSLLRTLIYIGPDDRTKFAVDQPSTPLHGSADPAAAALATKLDHQLSSLPSILGITADTLHDTTQPETIRPGSAAFTQTR